MNQQLPWDEAVGRLKSRVSPQNYDMWLRPIEVTSWDGNTLRLRAPNSYVRIWFESNFLSSLVKELRDLGHEQVRVEFDPDNETKPTPVPLEMAVGSTPTVALPERNSLGQIVDAIATVPSQPTSSMAMTDDQPGIVAPDAATLNPRYTFDTFVAGPSNQLAFAASQAAASSYPPKYNPVFICGGVGLGKTHLLHSIGHQQLLNRPGARIVYISSERFMNEYVQAIRTGKMHEFRRNYREGIDVLLVDDVQFLAGKESTQDEFFHTFNALHENHKQIVLTADRKPHEISDIAEMAKSRPENAPERRLAAARKLDRRCYARDVAEPCEHRQGSIALVPFRASQVEATGPRWLGAWPPRRSPMDRRTVPWRRAPPLRRRTAGSCRR